MQIEEYIVQLLKTNTCVVLPNIGAFIANHKSASVNELTNKFHPPSSAISFNRSIIKDDGLLFNHIAEEEKISYKEIKDQVGDYLDLLNTSLKAGDTIELVGLGQLYLNISEKISFEPELNENFLLDSFGLAGFYFEKLPAKIVEPIKDKSTVIINIDNRSLGKFKRIAAIFMFAVFAYIMLLLLNNNHIITSKALASINPFLKTNTISYLPRSVVSDIVFEDLFELSNVDSSGVSTSNLAFIDIETNGSATRIPLQWNKRYIAVPESTKVENIRRPNTEYYLIVGGVFGNIINAKKLVQNLKDKGYNAQFTRINNGLYRVIYDSYASKTEAIRDLIVIKSENSGAWIYSPS